jgi:hypothetical protein
VNKYIAALVVTLMLAGAALGRDKGTKMSPADVAKQQAALQNTTIIPGRSVGPIRLGMGMDEVQDMLGKPFGWTNADNISGASWRYPDLNLQISFDRGAAPVVTGVQAVAFSRKRGTLGNLYWKGILPVKIPFQTGNGITLGSSAFDVRRAYSNYGYEDTGGIFMTYKSLGLAFSTTMDHVVWAIGVYAPQ